MLALRRTEKICFSSCGSALVDRGRGRGCGDRFGVVVGLVIARPFVERVPSLLSLERACQGFWGGVEV